jgi:hypothetical protein
MAKYVARFTPRSLEDVFAIYLARELEDLSHIGFYVALVRRYSLCVLLNALRRARTTAPDGQVTPARFHAALLAVSEEDAV